MSSIKGSLSVLRLRDELVLLNRRVNECSEQLVLKKKKLTLVEDLLKETSGNVDTEIKKWGSVVEMHSECCRELELKKEKLVSVEKALEESETRAMLKKQELDSPEKSKEACSSELHEKEKELLKVKKSLDEWVKNFHVKANHLKSVKSSIEKCNEELKFVEKRYVDMQKLVKDCTDELAVRKKELEGISELESKQKELKLVEENISKQFEAPGECCRELELKREKLVSVEKALEESETRAMLKLQELDSLENSKDACSRELHKREKELIKVKKSLVEWVKDFHLKVNQLKSVESSIEKRNEELKFVEKQYEEMQNLMKDCTDELAVTKKESQGISGLESKQKELKLVEESISKQFEELNMKENYIHSLEASVKERFEDLETKQVQFEDNLKEFEVQKNWLVLLKESMENDEREFGSNEENDTIGVEVKAENTEYPLEAKGRKRFQFWSWERLEKDDRVSTELLSTLKALTDPAVFALDALKMFSHMEPQQKDKRADIRAFRKCLLLEHLMSIMPEVRPSVQKDAMALAVKWKAKMEILLEHYSLMALAFLQLVAAYGFSSDYHANQLRDLLNLVSNYRNINQLCQALGLVKESPGFCGTIPAAVVSQSTCVTSAQAISTIDGPNSSQSYSKSPQAGKRMKEFAKKRRCDFYILPTIGGNTPNS